MGGIGALGSAVADVAAALSNMLLLVDAAGADTSARETLSMGQATQSASDQGRDVAGRLGFLSSPTEVAIGIAVAYLGFDRFRYEKRIRNLAIEKARQHVSMKDTYLESIKDGIIDNDEKGIITLYYYGGGDKIRRLLRRPENKAVLKESDFFYGFCTGVMWFLTIGRLDRRIVQLLLAILCIWVIMVTVVLHGFDDVPLWMDQPWVGLIYYWVVGLAIALPGAFFLLSEFLLLRLNFKIKNWVKGLEVNLAKRAAVAQVGPAPPVPPQPAVPRPKPPQPEPTQSSEPPAGSPNQGAAAAPKRSKNKVKPEQ